MPDRIDPSRPVMAFDVGGRRTGVAVGSSFGQGATPIGLIMTSENGIDWSTCEKFVREWRPSGFIVGDPMTQDGGDQPARQRAKAFARELIARFKLPVEMMDERTSSIEAAQRFADQRASGTRKKQDAALLDAMAAAVILDRWLRSPHDGVPFEV